LETDRQALSGLFADRHTRTRRAEENTYTYALISAAGIKNRFSRSFSLSREARCVEVDALISR
jgi:hypothetical protein